MVSFRVNKSCRAYQMPDNLANTVYSKDMEMQMIGSSTQVNFFINKTLLKADNKAILKLVPFIEDGFVPSFGEEVNGNGVKNKILRIEKESEGLICTITFGIQAISFQFDSSVTEVKAELFEKVQILVKKLVLLFDSELSEVNRISVVINQGYEYNADFEARIHNKFFKSEIIPYEWNFRRACETEFENVPIYHILAVTKGTAIININGAISERNTVLLSVDNNVNVDIASQKFRLDDLSFAGSLFSKSVTDYYNLFGE